MNPVQNQAGRVNCVLDQTVADRAVEVVREKPVGRLKFHRLQIEAAGCQGQILPERLSVVNVVSAVNNPAMYRSPIQ